MKFPLLLIGVLFSVLSFAQNYSGHVYDQSTKEPLAFVNIGIIAQGEGTVAQFDGSFSLFIPDDFNSDTLKISMLGYKSKSYKVSDFKRQFDTLHVKIYLTKDTIFLKPLVINPRDMKSVTLGNSYSSPNVVGYFKSEQLGTELGMIMKTKKDKEYYLESCGFNIAFCQYDSILFRVNVYNYKDDSVGAPVNTKPIYVELKKGQTSIEVNLEPFDISVTNDFVVSLEWIQDVAGSKKNVGFCAGFFGSSIVARNASQDKWEKIPVISTGIWCDALYEK